MAAVDPAGAVEGRNVGSTYGRAVAAGIEAPDANAVLIGVGGVLTPPPFAGSVDVFPPITTLPVGNVQQIIVRARDADGNLLTPPATFTPSAPGIVTVDANGVITAIAPGVVTITVTGPGFTKFVTITVVADTTAGGLELIGPESLTVSALGPLPTPLQANFPDVFWESSNPGVATVDQNGNVVAIADGVTTITVRRGSQVDSMTLTVDQRPSFITVHSNLNGDPRQIVSHGEINGVTISATAFDFNGNAMPIDRIYTDDGPVASVASQTGGALSFNGIGSTYVRAVSKGVTSDTPNSVRVVALAPLEPPLPPTDPSPSPSPSATPTPPPGGTGGGGPIVAAPNPVIASGSFLTLTPSVITVTVGGQSQLDWSTFDVNGNALAGTPGFAPVGAAGTFIDASPTGVVTGKVDSLGVPAVIDVFVTGATTRQLTVYVVSDPPPAALSVNLTAIELNAYGLSDTFITASTTGTGPITFDDNANGLVTIDAAGRLNASGFADTVAPVNITVRDAGGNAQNVAVTVRQRAAYVYVRVPTAVLPNDPRKIYVANIGQQFNVEVLSYDANGFNAFDHTLATSDGNGWSHDMGVPNPLFVNHLVNGPAANAARGVATARVTANAVNGTFIRFRGKGLTVDTDAARSLEVVVGSALAATVTGTINLP